MKERKGLDFLVPAILSAVFIVLAITGLSQRIEGRIYDLFLRVRPAIAESPKIIFLDVDDLAISKVGVWPWSRDFMANGLILMREFKAGYALFDIEYVEQSPRGVDTYLLRQTVPDAFNQEFAQIQTNVEQLFEALRRGDIPLKDASKYVAELSGLTTQGKLKLLETVQSVERNNDIYLGQAARFFGNAFFTVNTLEEADPTVAKELEDYALANLSLSKVTVESDPALSYAGLRPAILPVVQGARGAGFPNVIIDEDGVRRRIDLVRSFKGKYFGQLAFRPLLAWLGEPEIVLHTGSIVLKDAKLPDGSARDIRIPLTQEGQLLINWPKKSFLDSFRHLSYYELVYHRSLEEDLLYNLRLMGQSGYLEYHKSDTPLLDAYAYCENLKKEILEGGELALTDDYISVRAAFFDSVGEFLNGDAESRILKDIDRILVSESLSKEERKNVEEVRAQVPTTFGQTRGIYANLERTREILTENLPGSFCIIGNTGTSTTDIGVNPFEKEYMNVGTHAAVANTILQDEFLNEMPWWYSAAIAIVLSFAATFMILRLNPLRSILLGLAFVLAILAFGIGYFLVTGVYIEMLSPLGNVFLTFVALTVIKFLRSEKEKSFVRNAFGHYLSADVINDLLSNPDKLALGGEKKLLTAMFTDVKGFSTISEALDATELVRLLNMYLTEMSNIVLDLRGTIDKYEGDAIISFFGAPIDFADHARRACLAAIRMKRAEIILNKKFLDEKLSPTTLHTRIGINTGEMVVGNMGTLQKMDYTIMGNSVNLAARLEGVNKQYGTWLMISDATYEAGGKDFVVRKLDRVRVVGINTPVRLYELVEEKGAVEKTLEEAIQQFHAGLELFEAKNWDKAELEFLKVLKQLPEDGPAKMYAKRCQEFRAKAPAESWDGVFNLTAK